MVKIKLPNIGQCALCLNTRALCNSHVLPELFYTDVYDDDHFMLEVTSRENVHKKRRPKGWYERLLCSECEGKLQKYEDEGKRLRDRTDIKLSHVVTETYKMEGFDYTKFKLFLLSILWRMSVSKGDSYDGVQLGKHEETIRLMLYNGDAGAVGDFGTTIGIVNHDGKHAKQFIFNPSRNVFVNPNTGVRVTQYIIVVAGYCFWYFVCTADKLEPIFVDLMVQREGWFYTDYHEMLKINGMAGAIAGMILNDRKLTEQRRK